MKTAKEKLQEYLAKAKLEFSEHLDDWLDTLEFDFSWFFKYQPKYVICKYCGNPVEFETNMDDESDITVKVGRCDCEKIND